MIIQPSFFVRNKTFFILKSKDNKKKFTRAIYKGVENFSKNFHCDNLRNGRFV